MNIDCTNNHINFNARIRIKSDPSTIRDLVLNSNKQTILSKAVMSNVEGNKGYAYTSAGSSLNSTGIGISAATPSGWEAIISYPLCLLSVIFGQKWIYKGIDKIRAAECKIIPTIKNIPD